MSYVLDAGKNRHNMDTLSKIHLGHKTISYKDLVGTGKKQINFNEVEIDVAKDYAAEDADITFRLYKKFLLDLKNEKLIKYISNKKVKIKNFGYFDLKTFKNKLDGSEHYTISKGKFTSNKAYRVRVISVSYTHLRAHET